MKSILILTFICFLSLFASPKHQMQISPYNSSDADLRTISDMGKQDLNAIKKRKQQILKIQEKNRRKIKDLEKLMSKQELKP